MNAYKNQRDRIEALEAFINRFRYQATKAKQVQSRIKELEKIERIEVPEEEATIHFTIPQPPASGRTVIEVYDLTKDLPDARRTGDKARPRRRQLPHRARRPHRAGRRERRRQIHADPPAQPAWRRPPPATSATATTSSPTTSRRTSTRCSTPTPHARRHHRRRAQGPRSRTPLAARLLHVLRRRRLQEARRALRRRAQPLRHGQDARLARSNFLLLDEPTNHLDLRAKDVLLDAIRNFTGTVLFVSHDRYFIDGLATRVFEVEDRRVHIYPGNYEDYLWRKQGGPEKVTEQITNSLTTNNPPGAPSFASSAKGGRAESSGAGVPHIDPDVWASSETRPLSPEPAVPIKRLNPIKLKQLEDRLQHAEQEIPRLEDAIAAVEARLGNFTSADQSQKDAAELESLRTKRTTLLAEWEELSLTLEEQQTA